MNRADQGDAPDGFGGVYIFGTLADFLAGAPDQFRQAFGQAMVDFPVTSIGAFTQDHWSVTRRVTLDFGVRYDFEHLPSGFGQATHDFSPRMGLAWSPSAKWVLRAGYGIFFDRYVVANLARAVEKNGVQGFEQVADGNAAAALFAAGGGALAAPAAGIAPSIFRVGFRGALAGRAFGDALQPASQRRAECSSRRTRQRARIIFLCAAFTGAYG